MQMNVKQRLRMVNAAGAAVVVLLVASTVVFGVVPLYRQGTQNIADAQRLRSQVAALDTLGQTLVQVEAQRIETEGRLTEVEKRLPNSSEINAFIKELSKVTQQAGIQVDGTEYPKELKDSGGYKSLPVQVIGTGDWDACYKFLTGLRTMNRLTRLDSLVLEIDKSIQTKNPERPICRITVNFSTFFMER